MAKENRWPGWGQHTLERLGVGVKIIKKVRPDGGFHRA